MTATLDGVPLTISEQVQAVAATLGVEPHVRVEHELVSLHRHTYALHVGTTHGCVTVEPGEAHENVAEPEAAQLNCSATLPLPATATPLTTW